jgi:hypothetical protein
VSQIEVVRWTFWSPESNDPSEWLEHWRQPDAVPADADPPATSIPPMQRRRMSRLAKMALSSALEVAGDDPVDYSIFCSQHGEIGRTREILSSISANMEVSPAAFAQSVHNTSSGLYTIIASSNHASTSIASGANTFPHAWLEAECYLATHPDHRVLLVDFDEVIPVDYHPYTTQVQCDHALALLLRASPDGGIRLSRIDAGAEQQLPQGPQFLAWLQGQDESLSLAADGLGWQWAR